MPERKTVIRAGLAILAVSLVSLLFIASYAGALHSPKPHDVPIAVPADAPAAIGEQLDASSAFEVVAVADREDALRSIDEREAYGAVLFSPGGLTVVESPPPRPPSHSSCARSSCPGSRPPDCRSRRRP